MKNLIKKMSSLTGRNNHHQYVMDLDHPHILLSATAKPLEKDLQWALATGAPLSLTNEFPLNVIDPEQPKQHLVDWLANFWNIYTRDDLGYELTNLFAAGHSKVFNTLLQFSDGYTSAERTEKAIQQLRDEMRQSGGWEVNTSYDWMLEFSDNIPEAVAFIYGHFAPLTTSIQNIRTEAYDIDRIVTISRVAYGAKLFDAALAEQNILWAASYAQAVYKDWREFAIGDLLGRAIWGGVTSEDFRYRVKIVDLLLKDPQSPWITLGWVPSHAHSISTDDLAVAGRQGDMPNTSNGTHEQLEEVHRTSYQDALDRSTMYREKFFPTYEAFLAYEKRVEDFCTEYAAEHLQQNASESERYDFSDALAVALDTFHAQNGLTSTAYDEAALYYWQRYKWEPEKKYFRSVFATPEDFFAFYTKLLDYQIEYNRRERTDEEAYEAQLWCDTLLQSRGYDSTRWVLARLYGTEEVLNSEQRALVKAKEKVLYDFDR